QSAEQRRERAQHRWRGLVRLDERGWRGGGVRFAHAYYERHCSEKYQSRTSLGREGSRRGEGDVGGWGLENPVGVPLTRSERFGVLTTLSPAGRGNTPRLVEAT